MKTTLFSLLIALFFAATGLCLPEDPDGGYRFKKIKIKSTAQPKQSLFSDKHRFMETIGGTEEKYPTMKKWESHLANRCKKHSECKGWYASSSGSQDRLGHLFKGSALAKDDFEKGHAHDARAYVKTKKKAN